MRHIVILASPILKSIRKALRGRGKAYIRDQALKEGFNVAVDVLKEEVSTFKNKLIACLEEKDQLQKNSFQLPNKA